MAERRKKGSGSIIKQDDGTYIVRVRSGRKPNGQPYEKSRKANTQAEAKRKLKQIREEIEREKEQRTEGYSRMTVSEYFDMFLSYKRQSLSDTSYRRLESTVNTHIKPFFTNVKFNELNSDMIQGRINEVHADGKSYSSVKKLFDAFSGCFRYAVARGDLKPHEDPMLAVSMIAAKKFSGQHAAPRYLKNDDLDNERERFVSEALRKYKNGKYVYRYGPALVFMLNTGLRESEMCALSYETIHPDENYIEVRDSAASVRTDGHYRVVVRSNETKWDSGRYVPLNDTAREMLTEMAKMFDDTEFVISTVRGTVLPPLELTKSFNRICSAADITKDMKGVGAHCLRHTFATSLFEQGIDPKVISELLGHSNISVTMNTYVSVANRIKAKAVSIPSIK